MLGFPFLKLPCRDMWGVHMHCGVRAKGRKASQWGGSFLGVLTEEGCDGNTLYLCQRFSFLRPARYFKKPPCQIHVYLHDSQTEVVWVHLPKEITDASDYFVSSPRACLRQEETWRPYQSSLKHPRTMRLRVLFQQAAALDHAWSVSPHCNLHVC